MKIILIGANGTIGRGVHEALAARHEVVRVGRAHGEYKVDISVPNDIRRLYDAVMPFDAVVCAAGPARFKPLHDLSDSDISYSLANKLMGQVNLVRFGAGLINKGGSFTLTSGVLASEPMPGSAAISLVNAGLEGFVRAAALELAAGVRVNVVSPPWVSETLEAMGKDPAEGMPSAKVAMAYVESVEGAMTGQVYDARNFR